MVALRSTRWRTRRSDLGRSDLGFGRKRDMLVEPVHCALPGQVGRRLVVARVELLWKRCPLITEFVAHRRCAQRLQSGRRTRILPYPDTLDTLDQILSENRVILLVTTGRTPRQLAKVEQLGLSPYFELGRNLYVHEPDDAHPTKDAEVRLALASASLLPEESLSVGDKLDADVRVGNLIGMQAKVSPPVVLQLWPVCKGTDKENWLDQIYDGIGRGFNWDRSGSPCARCGRGRGGRRR